MAKIYEVTTRLMLIGIVVACALAGCKRVEAPIAATDGTKWSEFIRDCDLAGKMVAGNGREMVVRCEWRDGKYSVSAERADADKEDVDPS